jgi:hypothetical protein
MGSGLATNLFTKTLGRPDAAALLLKSRVASIAALKILLRPTFSFMNLSSDVRTRDFKHSPRLTCQAIACPRHPPLVLQHRLVSAGPGQPRS